jgi:molecular chaperone DnaK
MQHTIGIDFGTTNSYVAVRERHAPSVIATREGGTALPSYVSVAQNGRRLVGQLAQGMALSNAENTVYGIKRLLGRQGSSMVVKNISRRVPYRLVRGEGDQVVIPLPKWRATPVEICSLLLTEERRLAEAYLDTEVTDAVLSVPSYFGDPQVQALTEAARAAGLQEVMVVDEPTAAVHAFGFDERIGRTVLVYHLGGSTFEASVLSIGNFATEVVSTAGESFLGGEDINQLIIDWLVKRCREEHGIDLRGDTLALQALKTPAELAKREASNRGETEIQLSLEGDDGCDLELSFSLCRTELEQMATPLIQRTFETCDWILEQVGLTPSRLDEVLLIGGQTRMQRVQELVEEHFGNRPTTIDAPEETVALGACIAAQAAETEEPLELKY